MKDNSLKSTKNSEILSIEEAAQLTGIHISTIKKYLDFGLLELVKNEAGESCLLEDDLLTIFQPGQVQPSNKKATKENKARLHLAKGSSEKQESKKPNKQKEQPQDTDTEFLLEVIEINRNLRDRLKSLQEDNSWLKTRIESLEKSVEREQTLQAAQLETIGRLARNQASFFGENIPKISSGLIRLTGSIGKKGKEFLKSR